MAERGPRTEGGRREREGHGQPEPGAPVPTGGCPDTVRPTGTDAALVRIRDLAGRPLGLGFLADHEGTLLTSHETVDGRPRLLLHAPGERTRTVTADAVTPLPRLGLALIRTEGLAADPLPLTVRERIDAGTYVQVAAGCWRQARVLAAARATYTAGDGPYLLADVLELAIGTAGRDALRPGGGAAGGPVCDARTGAVVGVLGTALRSAGRDAGFAVPLRPADDALAGLLARNAATVPAYGADLNLAGILQLTTTSVGQDGPRAPPTRSIAPASRGSWPPSPTATGPCSAWSAPRAAAVRPSSRPSPPAAPGARSPRPPCGCAAPTWRTPTARWPTPRAAPWPGPPGSSPRPAPSTPRTWATSPRSTWPASPPGPAARC